MTRLKDIAVKLGIQNARSFKAADKNRLISIIRDPQLKYLGVKRLKTIAKDLGITGLTTYNNRNRNALINRIQEEQQTEQKAYSPPRQQQSPRQQKSAAEGGMAKAIRIHQNGGPEVMRLDEVQVGTPGPGHRKVVRYITAEGFGGSGDGLACDAPAQGGFTHGHVVAATALGNPRHAAQTLQALDANGNAWELFGVAPEALLAFYDAQVTPPVGSCQDPLEGALDPGDLYVPGAEIGRAHV